MSEKFLGCKYRVVESVLCHHNQSWEKFSNMRTIVFIVRFLSSIWGSALLVFILILLTTG